MRKREYDTRKCAQHKMGLVIPSAYCSQIANMDNEEAGALFKALTRFCVGKPVELPELTDRASMLADLLFADMETRIDKRLKKRAPVPDLYW